MSVRSAFLALTTFAVAAACSETARASDFYAGLYAGPAYLHNHHGPGLDSAGMGFATQLDLGARATREFAWHATFIADHSPWTSVDGLLDNDYETTVLGLGVGATFLWPHVSVGVSTGAQLTWHPDVIDAGDEPTGAGIGPFLSLTAGYVFPGSDGVQLRALGLARYRVGKDEQDPSGYHLGAGLSIALVEKTFEQTEPAVRSPVVTRSESSGAALSAQIGWWNAELELLIAPGIYLAVGGPWVGALLGPASERLILPFGARLGYQLDVGAQWKLRAAAHLAGLYGAAGKCNDCSSDAYGSESWQLFEVGARYESGTGLVYGIDVPLLVVNDVLGLDNQPAQEAALFAPPISLAFLQVYVGYSWAL